MSLTPNLRTMAAETVPVLEVEMALYKVVMSLPKAGDPLPCVNSIFFRRGAVKG